MNGLHPVETRAMINLTRTNNNNYERARRNRIILLFGFIFFALVRIWIFIAEYNNTALTVVFLLFNVILLLCMYKYIRNSAPEPVIEQTEEDLLWQLITLQILRDHLAARELDDQHRGIDANRGYGIESINQLPTVCYPGVEVDIEANMPADHSNARKISLKYSSLDSVEHLVVTDTHCCICLEEYVTDEVLVVLPCNHVYHKTCCSQWLSSHRTCPLCNQVVTIALPYVNNPVREQLQHQDQDDGVAAPEPDHTAPSAPVRTDDIDL